MVDQDISEWNGRSKLLRTLTRLLRSKLRCLKITDQAYCVVGSNVSMSLTVKINLKLCGYLIQSPALGRAPLNIFVTLEIAQLILERR